MPIKIDRDKLAEEMNIDGSNNLNIADLVNKGELNERNIVNKGDIHE